MRYVPLSQGVCDYLGLTLLMLDACGMHNIFLSQGACVHNQIAANCWNNMSVTRLWGQPLQHHDPAWRQGEPSWLLFLSDITDFLDARGMTSDNYGKYMETRCLWHTPCIPLVCLCSYCITLGGFNTELCSLQYSSVRVSYAAGNWETDIENCIPYN